jgi:hypothetical protein
MGMDPATPKSHRFERIRNPNHDPGSEVHFFFANLEPLFDVGEDALVPGVQHQLPHHALLTWSLCLMLEKMLWFQESSISFLTTLSSVSVFFATAVVVFP